MRTGAKCRRARRRQAGVATAEAVIALPVLVLIFVGIVYAAQTGHRKQRLLSAARACAFRYANKGCQSLDDLPQDCRDALLPTRERDGSDLDDALPPGLLNEATDLPAIGMILEQLVGRTVEARYRHRRARPVLLGGGELETTGAMQVLCNTVPNKGELIDTVFDTYWDKYGG